MKYLVNALLTVLLLLLASAPAYPHGDVPCEGCHTMHNSYEGQPIVNVVGPFLLKALNISEACLNCHIDANDSGPTSYHIATTNVSTSSPPLQMTPGGDFSWLRIDYPTVIEGVDGINKGERRGHNIIATELGYVADTTNTVSPGGTYPASQLGCNSCHDPHGTYRRFADGSYKITGLPISGSGSYNDSPDPIPNLTAVTSYRMLAGVGYGYWWTGFNNGNGFQYQPPDAVAPHNFNRSEADGQTHVVYGTGMSEWCGNCHQQMLETAYKSGEAGHRHPAGMNAKLTDTIIASYNSYITSGVATNSDPNKTYSSLVPFEMGTNDYRVLKALAVTTDTVDMSASSSSNVMCLTCHRAHASAFRSALRFSANSTFMTILDSNGAAAYDDSTTDNSVNQGLNAAAQTNAYYGRPASAFGGYARALCNKCHAKD